MTNNLFQNGNVIQSNNGQDPYSSNNMNSRSSMSNFGYQSQNNGYPMGSNTNNFAREMLYGQNRSAVNNSSIPGRVVFSPDQISPQEIPTNGSPALFPLIDGSWIIAKALLPNGTFDEQRYMLVPKDQPSSSGKNQPSEFDMVMARLDSLEEKIISINGKSELKETKDPTNKPQPKKGTEG